jgi:hypothetical protein
VVNVIKNSRSLSKKAITASVMAFFNKAIVIELLKLMEAAQSKGRIEYVHPAERSILHAQTEEEVLYPIAILVGKEQAK